jgi:hypothetical protein
LFVRDFGWMRGLGGGLWWLWRGLECGVGGLGGGVFLRLVGEVWVGLERELWEEVVVDMVVGKGSFEVCYVVELVEVVYMLLGGGRKDKDLCSIAWIQLSYSSWVEEWKLSLDNYLYFLASTVSLSCSSWVEKWKLLWDTYLYFLASDVSLSYSSWVEKWKSS